MQGPGSGDDDLQGSVHTNPLSMHADFVLLFRRGRE